MNAFATAGWNCVPMFASISASASSTLSPGRYGRSERIASKLSATIRKCDASGSSAEGSP